MKTHMICIPTLSGALLDELPGTLVNCLDMWHGIITERGNSSIPLARNNLADTFLKRTKFDSMIWIDSDILFGREELEVLISGDEPAVCATYAKKDDTGDVATYGMGFARVDRDVFTTLINGKHVQEFIVPGWNRVMHDFFICGAARNPNEPDGLCVWLNEDTGFWSLVKNANIPIRLETRLDLGHVGRKVYRQQHAQKKDGAFEVIESEVMK
jgi:hypothetical protein